MNFFTSMFRRFRKKKKKIAVKKSDIVLWMKWWSPILVQVGSSWYLRLLRSEPISLIRKNQNKENEWLYVLIMSRTHFRVLNICLNVKKLLARNRRDIWSLSDRNGLWLCISSCWLESRCFHLKKIKHVLELMSFSSRYIFQCLGDIF